MMRADPATTPTSARAAASETPTEAAPYVPASSSMSPLATVAAKSGERIAPASLVGAPEPPRRAPLQRRTRRAQVEAGAGRAPSDSRRFSRNFGATERR